MKLRYKLPFFNWLAQLFQKVSGIPPLVLRRARAGGLTRLTAYGGLKLQAKGVPNGYTVVDWVSNNVNTLVPTGVVIQDGDEFEIEITCTAVLGSFFLFQARDVISSGVITGLSGVAANNSITLASGFPSATVISQITRVLGRRFHFLGTCTSDTLTLTVEAATYSDTSTASFTAGSTGRPSTDLCLFGNKATSSDPSASANRLAEGCKVEFAKLKINGTYVLDLKPVTRDSDGTPGFINLVDGTFLTATEGSLNAGPVTEIVPTPDAPADLVCNNGIIKADYTRLEYLESTGTQYIVTNITGGATIKAEAQGVSTSFLSELVFSFTETGYAGSWLGQNNNPSGKWGLGDLASTTTVSYTTKATIDATFDLLDGKPHVLATINQQTVERTRTSSADLESLSLFATSNGSFPARVRIWYTEIIQNNVLVCSLLPAKRNSDNVLGLYDIVSGTFLTNAGTGNFVAGPALGNIYCDGLTETLRISTKNLYDVNAVTEGKYIGVNGVIGDDNNACYSDLIKVKSGQQYTFSGICGNIGIESNYKRIHGYIDGVWDSQIMQRLVLKNQPYSITFTIPQNVNGIRISCWKDDTKRIVELGSSATTYVDYNNSTATTEMLLKLGDYVDSQDILNGIVNRQLGIQTLTGDETWTWLANSQWKARVSLPTISWSQETAAPILSNQFIARAWNDYDQTQPYFSLMGATTNRRMAFAVNWNSNITSLEDWQQWLQDQYNNGTPVIVVYPLATPTTESVTLQPMSVVDGDNTLEITQTSLPGLELEAEYKRH